MEGQRNYLSVQAQDIYIYIYIYISWHIQIYIMVYFITCIKIDTLLIYAMISGARLHDLLRNAGSCWQRQTCARYSSVEGQTTLGCAAARPWASGGLVQLQGHGLLVMLMLQSGSPTVSQSPSCTSLDAG